MSRQTVEATIGRTLGQAAKHDTEQALWAALLVRHFEAEVYYTPVGSPERDAEARLTGEFKAGFKDPSERSAEDILVDAYSIPTDTADFDALELEGELQHAS